ncbi:OmpA family protein [Psychromonas sp. MME2]|uniref:OmpA family protein n=1 Tax=unclassified Psychromonas TaxID=2614957 RepID=UPI00339CB5B2
MRFLIPLFLLTFTAACSVQVIDMTPEPTPQVFDLSDSEADGVIIARDKCPDSPAGALVDNDGCSALHIETARFELLVNFDIDSYQVKPEYFSEIESLATFMGRYPATTLVIEGHTSIRGTRSHNQLLSQRRAEAIKNILVNEFAIDVTRITAIGYGFERLMLEGDDEYIHAKNRRIVAEISGEYSVNDLKWTIYSVDEPSE